jgi:glycosyltransferase involved in cell wall biosynthesis
MPDDILIIVPLFNAEMHLHEFCSELQLHAQADILFIDDGSKDDTQIILKQLGYAYLSHHHNFGKGRALKTGMRYAVENNYKYVLTLDGDMQHPPKFIQHFLQKSAEDEIVIGYRSDYSIMPLHRRFSNIVTSLLISIRTGKHVMDSQCGFRLYPMNSCRCHDFIEDGFQFESEILIKSLIRGYGVSHVEIPTIYGTEKSSMRNIRDTLKFITMYFRSFFW